jgi:hypothetical protein
VPGRCGGVCVSRAGRCRRIGLGAAKRECVLRNVSAEERVVLYSMSCCAGHGVEAALVVASFAWQSPDGFPTEKCREGRGLGGWAGVCFAFGTLALGCLAWVNGETGARLRDCKSGAGTGRIHTGQVFSQQPQPLPVLCPPSLLCSLALGKVGDEQRSSQGVLGWAVEPGPGLPIAERKLQLKLCRLRAPAHCCPVPSCR